MSRIYWDTMLFIYWFENVEPYAGQIEALFERMLVRGDRLMTSTFTLGELLVIPQRTGDRAAVDRVRRFLQGPQVDLMPIDIPVIERYAQIRAQSKVKPADAIHLASAARAGIDLFLTNDFALRKLTIDGIDFIDGLETTALGVA